MPSRSKHASLDRMLAYSTHKHTVAENRGGLLGPDGLGHGNSTSLRFLSDWTQIHGAQTVSDLGMSDAGVEANPIMVMEVRSC